LEGVYGAVWRRAAVNHEHVVPRVINQNLGRCRNRRSSRRRYRISADAGEHAICLVDRKTIDARSRRIYSASDGVDKPAGRVDSGFSISIAARWERAVTRSCVEGHDSCRGVHISKRQASKITANRIYEVAGRMNENLLRPINYRRRGRWEYGESPSRRCY
jgi:hypothetical protein